MVKKILALITCALLIFALASCNDAQGDKGNTTLPDYFIEYLGVKIEVGTDAMSTIEKLGQYTREVGEACGTDEMDVIYTFSGLEIETHIKGDEELIRRIRLLDDSITTPEGITIGSTRDEVVSAYGKSYSEGSGGAIRYEGASSTIEFHFGASGNVSNIYVRMK